MPTLFVVLFNSFVHCIYNVWRDLKVELDACVLENSIKCFIKAKKKIIQ